MKPVFASFLILLFSCTVSQALSQANQWTFIKGDSLPKQYGIYGTKGVPSSANKPGSREEYVSLTDHNGNFWLFGGYGRAASTSGYLNDLWKYNSLTNEWTWVSGDSIATPLCIRGTKGISSANNKPNGRFSATGWTDAANNLWIFGGESNSGNYGHNNDLWKYSISNSEWTWVKGDSVPRSPGVYGIMGVSSATNNPGAREWSIGWTDASGYFWLFGGMNDTPFGALNDLWRYSTNTNEWTWMKGDSIVNRHGFYGTQGTSSSINKPAARFRSTSWIDKAGILWLFGGDGVAAYQNDLWKYDIGTNNWTWMKGSETDNALASYVTIGIPDPSNTPGAKAECSSWTDTAGNLWLFGGTRSGYANDLWKYVTKTNEWIFIKESGYGHYGTQGISSPLNKPSPRAARTTTWVDSAGNLLLFGGVDYNYAYSDLWKYSPDYSRKNSIVGFVFLDNNLNGIQDNNEPFFNNVRIQTVHQNIDTISTYISNGRFFLYTDTGTYITSATPYRPYYNVVPASHTIYHSYYNYSDTVLFAMQPTGAKRDLTICLIPFSGARGGSTVRYKIFYANNGTDTAINTQVKLVKDSRIGFNFSSVTPTAISGDTLLWNITDLKPIDTGLITILFNIPPPPTLTTGDTVKFLGSITSSIPDVTPADNSIQLLQKVMLPYDPNNKIETHGGSVTLAQVNNDEYLYYTINFQNTGTDTAFNVVVKDTLSNVVDWSSLEMLSANANYQLNVNDGNCAWTFNNINLVDSNRNEPQSHGYLTYRIKVKSTATVGNIILNTAGIYFDNNPVVLTNIDTTAIVSNVLPLQLVSFIAKKNGKRNLLQWNTANITNVDHFAVQRSNNGREYISLGTVRASSDTYQFEDGQPLQSINYYRLKMIDKDGTIEYSPVRTVNNSSHFIVNIYPNPVTNKLQLQIESDEQSQLQAQIVSTAGNSLYSAKWNLNEGTTLKTVNISILKNGYYFLKVTAINGEQRILKFEKLD